MIVNSGNCAIHLTTILKKMVAVLFAVVFLGSGLLQAQNLLTNGVFESGFTNWSNVTSGSTARATFALETSQPYAGVQALRATVTNTGPDVWNVESQGQTLTNIGNGRDYTVTFRARAATAGFKLRAVMQSSTYRQQEFSISTNWTYYVWNASTAEVSPRFRFQYRSVGTVWIDEVSVVAHTDPTSGTLVTVDPSIRHQVMDGIGGAIAFNLPHYERLSATQKDEIENLLYDDCGIDIVRLRTGNSDALNNELAMRAQRNGAKSLLTSWSPPASLKSNNSTTSGTLRTLSANQYDYAGFANWWYDRLQASGWRHDYISIQNEPDYDPGDKETCRLKATQTFPATTGSASYKLALEAVYNKIKNEPNLPQFVACDSESHNAFDTLAPTVSGLSFVNHVAFHNYGINDFAQVNSRYNGNRGWMTEWGKDASETDPTGILENWMLLSTNIHDTLVQSNASAYLCWRMVHGANTGQVWAMIGVNAPTTTNRQYAVQNAFYAVKHYAKHISAGHQRIEAAMGVTNNNLRISGYLNPAANQITLVVLNTGGGDTTISLRSLGLPIASATSFRTRAFNMNPPFQSVSVNLASPIQIQRTSAYTFLLNLSGTLNPYNPSLLRVDGFQRQGNQVSLNMPAQPGQKFILWRSSTLAPGSWQQVTNAVATEVDGQLFLTDPTPSPERAFYRVEHE